jgi:hypothetical protein
MFILRRLNWRIPEVKEDEEKDQYDLHQDIWIRCMKQIKQERTDRMDKLRYEKMKREESMPRNTKNASINKIIEGGTHLQHQDSIRIRKTESTKQPSSRKL